MDRVNFNNISDYFLVMAEQARKAAKTVNPAELTREEQKLRSLILNATGNLPTVEPRRQAELISAFD